MSKKSDAKRKMLEKMREKHKGEYDEGMGKAMKVSVMAKDKKGLQEGMSKAQKLMKARFSEGGYKDPKMGQKDTSDSSYPSSDGIARRSIKHKDGKAKSQKPYGKDYRDGGKMSPREEHFKRIGESMSQLKGHDPKKEARDTIESFNEAQEDYIKKKKKKKYADGGLGGDASKVKPKKRKYDKGLNEGKHYADGGLGGDADSLSVKQRKMMELRFKKGY